MLSSVTFQYRVSGGSMSSTSAWPGSSRKVPIMYRLSGVVSAAPRSAASAVSSVLGLVEQLGLDGAVQRGELHQCPRHRGELLGEFAVGKRRHRVGIEGLDVQRGQLFGGAITDVFADDDRRRVVGDLHPLRAGEVGGSADESTSANSPSLSDRSMSLT